MRWKIFGEFRKIIQEKRTTNNHIKIQGAIAYVDNVVICIWFVNDAWAELSSSGKRDEGANKNKTDCGKLINSCKIPRHERISSNSRATCTIYLHILMVFGWWSDFRNAQFVRERTKKNTQHNPPQRKRRVKSAKKICAANVWKRAYFMIIELIIWYLKRLIG